MAEAGLLKSKQKLTNAELQNTIATQVGNESYAKAIMNHMGIAVAIEGEEAQTVQLTAKKLQQLVATGLLTAAQAKEIAMITGVAIAQNAQTASSMPKWIAEMKAMTIATWDQIKATVVWLATNPAGWCVLAAAAIASVAAALIYNSKAAERAQEKIKELQDDYSNGVSELESVETELSNINKRMEEIHSQGKISFTDSEELENLQKQSLELEKQLAITRELNQQKVNEIVAEINDNDTKLNNNFDKDLNNYLLEKQSLEELKLTGMEALKEGSITQENYDNTIALREENLNDYYGNLLESIQEFESNREAILNKYGGDASKITNASDKQLYDDISSRLQEAYRAIYSKSEYNKLYIEPIFQTESLNGLQQQLVDYFMNGGSLDTDALKEKFGTALIDALSASCDEAGIELSYLLEELYNQAQNTSYGFAPMPERINGQYEAKQHANSSAKIDYYNTLEDETKHLIINAEIPEEIKNGTLEDFKNWISILQSETKIDVQIDVTSSLSDIKTAYSAFEDIFNEIEAGTSVSASSLEGLTEKFGDLNDGESLKKFKNVLTSMPDDADACKEALNELATEYLDQSDLLQNLTDDNADYVESELEKLNVENAHEVVRSRLVQQDYSEADAKKVLVDYANQLTDATRKEELASYDLANATAGDIAGLINEANAAGTNTIALQSYLRQKIQTNAITLTTDGDINNLSALVSALGGATTYLEKYQHIKQLILDKDYKPGDITGYWKGDDEYLNTLKYQAESEIKRALANSTKANINYPSIPNSAGGTSPASEAKDTTKQYNWIETAINRVQEALSRLTKVRDNTYAGWTKRNTALNSEIAKITEEINLQQQAFNNYLSQADSIGLSQDYRNKIQNGTIEIENIQDEGLQDKIDQYQDWYNKAVECQNAIQDLNMDLSKLAEQKFDNIQTEFDSFISTITAQADVIHERLNRTEEQGYFADKIYYNQLKLYKTQEAANLQQEFTALQNSFREAVATGKIEEGSEAWSDMKAEILSVEQAMEESNTAIVEYNNSIRDLDWELFDHINDRIGQITEESEFLIDLLEHSNLYNENGTFNAEGKAVTALHGVNYNTYMLQSLDYAKELTKIEADLAKDQNNRDLIDRREELLNLQQDAIKNAEAEKSAIQSLVEDGIDLHLDALSELIEKYKESLNAAKDLYDYQTNISEQTENIANLEKILMAYQGDDSEEARQRIQDTKNQLEEARQELQETEWDKYIAETEDLLDTLYEDYETILNERLDNMDALIADMIQMVNTSGSEIRDAVNETTARVGYDITNTLNTIFGDGGKQVTLISNFMNKFDTASTTLQTAINDIKNSIHSMMTTPAIPANAGGTNKGGSSSGVTSSGGISSGSTASVHQTQSAAPSTQGDNIAAVGDLVTFINGKYHEDSWGNGRSGSQNLNGQVYITKIKAGSPYPYHISRGSTLGNGDLGWVKLDQLRGYQSGSKKINKTQLAFMNEAGAEIRYRSGDGAMMVPLGEDDMVFTHEMSQRLWNIAKGTSPITAEHDMTMPNISQSLYRNPEIINNSNDITITLPNVTNYAEFKNELQKDNTFAGFVREITLGESLGGNSLNKNRYI